LDKPRQRRNPTPFHPPRRGADFAGDKTISGALRRSRGVGLRRYAAYPTYETERKLALFFGRRTKFTMNETKPEKTELNNKGVSVIYVLNGRKGE
jgi:hypothetical protein